VHIPPLELELAVEVLVVEALVLEADVVEAEAVEALLVEASEVGMADVDVEAPPAPPTSSGEEPQFAVRPRTRTEAKGKVARLRRMREPYHCHRRPGGA
jgi:hypothetical protein